MKYDFHIHSKYSSDGILEPQEIVKIAVENGLDGIAITDHNTIKGGLEAKKYETKNLKVIIGTEIKTERGEIIGLFLNNEINSRKFEEVIKEIRKQKGVIIIPHPFDILRKSRFVPTKEDIKFIDCIEVYNSRCIFKKYNKNAINFAKKYNLKLIVGSDAHFKNEIGNAYVEMEKFNSRSEFLKNLTNTKIFGKRSSIIVHIFTKLLKILRK